MKGAITEPWVKIIKLPINIIVIIKGANQYFFLTLKKSQISLAKSKNASIKIFYHSTHFTSFNQVLKILIH